MNAANTAAPQQDWELSKENFQPLKAGRKASGLRDNTAELRKQLVEEQKREFWEEIATYSGEDPLEVWLKFIKWTQETFQAGGHKAELLPLLERCTRELQTLPRYKDDIRYLRVWVQYADCLPDPGDVFLFLKENEIGLEHALYYIAYATYLEFRGNYAKADAVYQQGINRLAAPVDRLKAKFAEFQQRMAKRIQRKAQEQQAGGVEFEHPGRHTLGTIGARRNSRAGGGLGGPAALKRKAASPPRPAEQENAEGLAIFTDDEFQEAAPAQSAPAALFAAGRSAAGPWSKLGSFEQSRKENTQHATSWAGQRIKQQPAHSAPPAPALDIPVDPEFQEQAATAGPEAVLNQQEPTLRQRLERGSTRAGHLDEALADDPLRLHRADPSLPPLAPVSVSMSRPALQPKAAEPPEAKRKREEILAFDEAAMSANGEELCFEELRSRAWKSKCPQEQATGTHLTSTCYPGYPYHIPATTIAEPQQANHAPGATLGQPQEQQLQAAAHENRLCEGQGLPSKTGHQAVEPTMTIATRDAFAAVNNMFQGSLPAEYTCLPPNPYAEPTMHTIHGAGYEPTMTLATRNAFSAINNMFKGSLPNEHTGLPPRSGMPEPTVTINTKAAFEAINGMFGGGGRAGEGRAGSTRQNQGIRDSRVRTRDEPTAPIVIQEDTQFIGGPSSQPAGGFAIREDTQFLPALSAAKPAGGFAIREDTLILPAPSAAKPAGGFAIREDTQFLPAPSAAKPAGGFAIREDTQLLEGFHAKQPQVFNIREDTQFGVGLAGNGFSIKEDTVFINAAPRPAAALGAKRKLGLQAHDSGGTAPAQTAAAAPQEQVSKWGFAPGCDDTLQLDLGETQSLEGLAGQLHPATAVGIKGTSGLSACLQELHIVEDKENTDGPRAVLRDIHAARSAATALRALQEGAAGADAELLLQQNLDGEDSFEVPEEGGSQGSAGSNCGQTSKQHAAAAATVDPGSQLVVVDPFHPSFQPAMLASLEPPVLQWPGVTGCSATEEAKVVAALKGLKKTGSTPIELTLGGECYLVSHQCGQGAYATVYQATTADGSPVALKLEAPPCPWEWYICQVLQARTHEADLRCGFIDPLSLVVGAGSSVLVTPHGGGGSVQDLLNIFLKQGQRPDEVVTMHFAMELLHLLGALHRARVVHADIKPDNLLVRVSHASGEDENAAPSVRLQLIDFGRSVDLELLPEGAVLQGDSGTDAFRCVEMREGTPWLYQADCYGVCGVVHCLLFGDYMEVDRVRDAEGNISLRLRQGFKRYWAQDLWADFFSTLLNHTGGMRPPPATQLLQQFELYLGSTPSVQRKLRNELRRVAAMCNC